MTYADLDAGEIHIFTLAHFAYADLLELTNVDYVRCLFDAGEAEMIVCVELVAISEVRFNDFTEGFKTCGSGSTSSPRS
jgi:hypothetical protein